MIQNKNQSITYIDANNLYGFGMSTFLPTDCALKVNLGYPKELGQQHNYYSLKMLNTSYFNTKNKTIDFIEIIFIPNQSFS